MAALRRPVAGTRTPGRPAPIAVLSLLRTSLRLRAQRIFAPRLLALRAALLAAALLAPGAPGPVQAQLPREIAWRVGGGPALTPAMDLYAGWVSIGPAEGGTRTFRTLRLRAGACG